MSLVGWLDWWIVVRLTDPFGQSGIRQWVLVLFAWNSDTAVPAEGNGDLQTLICVLVARPRRCLTLSNPVPWQNWMLAYLGCTLRMKMLFRGWPVMAHDTHTRRRGSAFQVSSMTMRTLLRYVMNRASVFCLWCCCTLRSDLNFSAIFLQHLMP